MEKEVFKKIFEFLEEKDNKNLKFMVVLHGRYYLMIQS